MHVQLNVHVCVQGRGGRAGGWVSRRVGGWTERWRAALAPLNYMKTVGERDILDAGDKLEHGGIIGIANEVALFLLYRGIL